MDFKDYNKQFQNKSKKNKKLLILAAFMVIAIAITAVFFVQTTGDNQGYRTISVVETSGNVSVVKDGIEYSAYPGMLLQEGHEIVTGGNSYVRLVLDDDKYVKIESGSKLVFETLGLLGSGKTRMNLERGAMTSELVNPLKSDEEFIVNAPNAVLAVRGTFFRIDLSVTENGEVKADVMTYGGQVASQRVLPTGETVQEEVLIDAGHKASINMTQETTHYVVETDDGEFIIVEPTVQETPDDEGETTIIQPTQAITTNDIPDDDLVDVYFAAENGHEMFVTVEEVKADLEAREIVVEEYKPVYEKAEEVKKEQEEAAKPTGGTSNTTSATVIANDSQPLAKVEEDKKEEKPSTPTTNSGGLVDGVHVHSKKTTTVAATCTTAGSEVVTCRSCKETLSTKEIPALGHTPVNSGTKNVHSICETCDEVLSTQHEMINTAYVAPSCTDAGSDTYACDCGYTYTNEVAALGHNFAEEFTIDVEVTCTTDGSKSKHCSQCSEKSEVTIISATGHTEVVGGTKDAHSICSVCDEVLSIEHTYTETVEVAPACIAPGTMRHSCECGYVYRSDIEATGHDWSEWTEVSYPTCEEAGENRRECNICYETEIETLEALGHTPINGGSADVHSICDTCDEVLSTEHEMTNTAYVAPSCTDAGSDTYACDCGYTYTNEIAALGHNFAEEFTIDVEVTCTTDGSKSKHCSQCSEKSEVTIISAIGHTETAGGTEGIHSYCSVCNETLEIMHEFTDTQTQVATCEEIGITIHVCDCGYEHTTETAALGHDYATDFIIDEEATCTTDGSKSKHCSRCDSLSEVTEIPATGHDWSEWTEVSYPTCEEAGENRRECNICYETETETLPATGHTPVDGGLEDVHSVCETCDEVLSTEHNMVNTAYVAPSCTDAGSDTYACDCGYTYTNEVAALGHNFAEDFTIDVEVTCTTDGSKSKHCSQCSETTEVTTISAMGHSETFGGTEEQHTFCAVCMETLSNVHAYTDTETLAATCETDGVMTHTCECSYEYTTVIDAFGHNYVEKEEVGDDGYTTTYEECENCGDVINETTVLALNTENFPDENFRAFLNTAACNTDGEEGLTPQEVSAITSLSLKGDGLDGQITTDGGIRDLTGIEYLTELTTLDVSYNANLSTLNVSENTKLTTLVASGSGITSMDTSGCSQLETLTLDYCDGLSTLDISDNTALVELIISNTNLTTFNAGANYYPIALLDIRNSGITTIEMDKFYEVQILKVDANLTELDLNSSQYLLDIYVAEGTALEELYVVNTQNLDSLNFEGTTGIKTIRIPQASGVRTLDLSNCPELTTLDVSGIGVTDLDLSQNTALTSLTISGSSSIVSLSLSDNENLNTLDVTNCSLLQSLSIPGLPITSLDLTGCNMLSTLEAYDCVSLSQIDLSDCTSLTSLDISGTPITGFAQSAQEGYLVVPDTDTATLLSLSLNNTNIEYSSLSQDEYLWWGALQNLNLGNAGVTQTHWNTISQYVPDSVSTLNLTGSTIENIDLSGYTVLSTLTLYGCESLTTLNATGCTALTDIVYNECQSLTTVDISGCTSIKTIAINALPAIETFNASGCTSATSFNAYSGGATLTTLDISGCTNLGELTLNAATNLVSIDMSDSGVTQLYATYQQSLKSIDASNCTALTALDVSNNDGVSSALETLDLTGCTELRVLDLSYCRYLPDTIDISACTKMSMLNLIGSNLTSLDATDFSALTDLRITDATELTSINVTNCTSLTSLDTSTLTNLTTLVISGSGLEGVDLTNNAALTTLTAEGSALTTLDVTACMNITDINVANSNSLKDFDAEYCSNLNQLNLSGCTTLDRVILTACTSLTGFAQSAQKNYIVVPNTATVTYLDLSQTSINYTNASEDKYTWFGNLETLLISNAGITDAYWEKISAYIPDTIKVLEIANNTISTLDVSSYTELTALRISSCSNLTSIDLSNNTELTNLECASSSLTALDLSHNTKLTSLYVGGSSLALPDLSNNTALTALSVSIEGLTSLDVSGLTGLYEFSIDGADITEINLTANASLGIFYASNCSELTTINLPSVGAYEGIGVVWCSKIETLDFSGFTMSNLELGECPSLASLYLSNCSGMTELNVAGCEALTTLDVTGSSIEQIHTGGRYPDELTITGGDDCEID